MAITALFGLAKTAMAAGTAGKAASTVATVAKGADILGKFAGVASEVIGAAKSLKGEKSGGGEAPPAQEQQVASGPPAPQGGSDNSEYQRGLQDGMRAALAAQAGSGIPGNGPSFDQVS